MINRRPRAAQRVGVTVEVEPEMGGASPGTASARSPKTYSIPLRASMLFGPVGQSRLFAALSRQTSGPLGGRIAGVNLKRVDRE